MMLPLLLLGTMSIMISQANGQLYGYGTGTRSSRSDDGYSPRITLQRAFPYFGTMHHQIYVNHNGDLTFDQGFSRYVPYQFPAHSTRDIIAPFWVDLDNRDQGAVFYKQYTGGSVLQQATRDIHQYFPSISFTASWVFVATWANVQYYNRFGNGSTVQAVLISGGQHSFVLMNYQTIDPTYRTVQAGYDTVNSTHHFSIPGSFPCTGSLNNYTNFLLGSNVNVAGRWAFRTDHGSTGCSFQGSSIQQGDSFWSDATCRQQCTCTSSGLQCQDQPCSFSQVCRRASFQFSCQRLRRRTCTVSGDPHYYTFDGTVFHFQGTCTYVLSESCGRAGLLPYYRVEGKNENRGSTRVAWTRLVKVFVYDVVIELVKGHRAEAKVDGSFTSTPFSLRNGSVQVYQTGFSLAVSTDFGLVVTYDAHHYVRISLPFSYQNATCGLCGNFNNLRADDFRTRQGELVNSDVEFANSWQAPGDDEAGCGTRCAGLACAGCTAAQTSLYGNTGHCGILQDPTGPFAPCHQRLPPQTYADSCVYDLCVGGGYQPILCQALSVYASQCQQHGIQPGAWRSHGFCEIPCPANSHFESQGTGCPATCTSPNSTQNCPIPPQESCICDPGHVLSSGVCVPTTRCGCAFEGRYYSLGQSVILDQACGRRCTCTPDSMSCQAHGCGPLEACRVEAGERGCRPTGYETCWVKGPRSYRTFDGLRYQYPGACSLTLTRVTGLSPYPHFTVTAEKVPGGQQGFQRFLKFEAEGTQVSIEMGGDSRVQVDGQLVQLPFSTASNRILLYHSSAHSIILHTSFGVTVQTDWPHLVRVTAPGVYNGSLAGLCGNYNGHQHDDFRTPNSTLASGPQDFGDSWRDGSLSAHCVERGDGGGGTRVGPNVTDYNQLCGLMASLSGPFAQCQHSVEPWGPIEECVQNMRASGGAEGVLCEALRDYALLCQQNRIPIGDWRNATGCGQSCPSSSHYELCGTSCPSSCPSLSFPFLCATACQEGCQCDDGFLLSGNRCVPPVACGCHHQGRYRQGGEQFWDGEECRSWCSCNGTTGAVSCAPTACGPQETCGIVGGDLGCHPNPRGTCSASGDPHYLTFDGRAYDFQGTCRYVLATVCNGTGGLQHFQVEGRNEARQGLPVSVTAEVYVSVGGHRVTMSRGQHGVVQVDDVTVHLPVLLHGGRVSIYASGFRTFVNADFGLSVSYDGGSTVSISVPSNYSGNTCGLCGNFNGNPDDDFRTPSGAVASSPSQLGTSWKVPSNDTCSDGCGSSCPRCAHEAPARAQCSAISSPEGPLSFCHGQVDPAPFFNDCVFDVCVSGDGGQDVLCRAIQTYVSACQAANAAVYPWRQNTTCRVECPAHSHYELCGTDCGHTCASSIDASCEQVCSEGCFCDQGFLRSGGRCVPVQHCGCLYDGFYYDEGESFRTPGCSQQCSCLSPDELVCLSQPCAAHEECFIRDGRLGCFGTLATCTVWGDPHYLTFDGALAHFQGTCSYVIAESAGHAANGTGFRVVATNNHRGDNRVSFVSAVDIHLVERHQSISVRIGPNRRVKVDGSAVTLPTSAGSLASVRSEQGSVVLHTPDLRVQFDGQHTLLVSVHRSQFSAVRGMCGNFNDDPSDDKVLPNGTLAQSDDGFGDGWKSPTSRPGCGSTDVRGGGGDCPFRDEFSQLCSVITNTSGPFSACHLHSDPQPFFSSCVYDLCLYTPANGMLCSAVEAYERSCSVLQLDIPAWRAGLLCAESDPCDALNCTEDEWCGEKKGVYGCFCDENHHRPNNQSYDSSITCSSSTGLMSVSRCQLFEAGFHPDVLHLQDSSCRGSLQDGRLLFNFDNEDNPCGTVLTSNGTHFIYQNVIQGDVDTHGHPSIISRQRDIHLRFCCVYPLTQSLSMNIGINPLESRLTRKLPSGLGHYSLRMVAYQDAAFRHPFSGANVEVEVDQRLYVDVSAVGIDGQQISVVLDSCWATPVNIRNHPVRWNLIASECPNPEDTTVDVLQNGVSTSARFSFRMFTFTNFSNVFLHCQIQLCLLHQMDCTAHCYPGYHQRARRDLSFHDSTALSMGPLVFRGPGPVLTRSSAAPAQLISLVTLLLSFLTAATLI